MKGTMKTRLTMAFAVVVTVLAVAMAIASAWQRADSLPNKLLMSCISAALVLAVHFLPALLAGASGWAVRLMVWPVWVLCFAAAMWGHAWFFTAAGHGAGEARAISSAQTQAVQEQRQTLEAALRSNRARSAATVAGLLAREEDQARRAALEIELVEAKRKNEIQDRLVTLANQSSETAAVDPVMARVAAVTGLPVEAMGLAVNVAMAVLLEVLGVLLWLSLTAAPARRVEPPFKAQAQTRPPAAPQRVDPSPVPPNRDAPGDIDRLRAGIESGQCTFNVPAIRKFLSCSQEHAEAMHRALLGMSPA